MPNYQRAFQAGLKAGQFRMGEDIYAGVGGIGVWQAAFATMAEQLRGDGATTAETDALAEAIRAAIDSAAARDLTEDERAALRAVLASSFDGMSRTHNTALAPKAQFLRSVRLPD